VGGRERLARRADLPRIDARLRSLAVEQIDDLIRDTIADLVRMAFRDRLAGEEIRRAHQANPLFRRCPDVGW
ncbi:hypothetical protein chiPu_0033987, partial [Chiloscyllium punctatum]|nr:hypothetical protein [Chiloscyllium punctatum]